MKKFLIFILGFIIGSILTHNSDIKTSNDKVNHIIEFYNSKCDTTKIDYIPIHNGIYGY